VHKPPSPLRKMFNFLCGSCMNANDIAHKAKKEEGLKNDLTNV